VSRDDLVTLRAEDFLGSRVFAGRGDGNPSEWDTDGGSGPDDDEEK
jgi:hypothetical protein